jgi:hypothetical protein
MEDEMANAINDDDPARNGRLAPRSRHCGRAALLSLPLLASCATTSMRLTPPPIATIDFINGREFIVTQPYRYTIGESGVPIEVPAGFVTDFASIPRSLQAMLPPHGRYGRATVIHDYLYWSQSCTREQADNLLMIAMKELGVRKRDRVLIYDGVRLGGRAAWEQNRRDRAAGKPKIVPADRWGLATDHVWADVRDILQYDGVHDPALPGGAAYCALGNAPNVPDRVAAAGGA